MNETNLAQFASLKYISLETFRKNGVGVKTPIWFVEYEGKLYAYSRADAWKIKRIRNNPNVRIAPCDIRGNIKGAWIAARSHILKDDEMQFYQQLLRNKYGWQKKLGDLFARFSKHDRSGFVIEL